jgi:SEC-C motif-containing protein
MRSRYTAYVLEREDYLRQTWHPDSRPAALELDGRQNWLGLKVLRTERGGESDDDGLVEFVARFKIDGRGHRLHEISRFERVDGRWFYLDGERGPTDSSLKL